ncbi:MarR family transcriptional regulator [Tichowtungia aerotolerans]|uniref:MarR family transcriptional regulator n=2 Tax=Tichowtungia aerotolerans TaxID=2697043 RepID=A0A6P1MAA0_9BACT|nr:MarR family transcriptional regulator [Tichowtungia aerotolerans]
MDSKEELAKTAIRQLLRIANRYARIEKMPISIGDGMEITTREVHTIQAVGEREQMCVTDVAAHFGVTKSAASQLIAKLEKKGFVEKMPLPGNNKELQLSLTEMGWQAFRAHETFHGKDLKRLIDLLGAYPLQQIATLSVMLEAIGSIMDERLGES